jgi:hypothetical protein
MTIIFIEFNKIPRMNRTLKQIAVEEVNSGRRFRRGSFDNDHTAPHVSKLFELPYARGWQVFKIHWGQGRCNLDKFRMTGRHFHSNAHWRECLLSRLEALCGGYSFRVVPISYLW